MKGVQAVTRRDGASEDFYLNSGLYQVQPQSQSLPHEHVRIVTLVKRLF